MEKDWIGNKNTKNAVLGVSKDSTTNDREENDFYETPVIAVLSLLKILKAYSFDKYNLHDINYISHNTIYEPACGRGAISKVIEEKCNKHVISSDLINRGYGSVKDFLKTMELPKNTEDYNTTIITNPPYKYALDFAYHAMSLLNDKDALIMLLKIQFLEGKERHQFFIKYPPKYVFVFSNRIECGKNGTFTNGGNGGACCFAWFIWEKGFNGLPTIDWL